MRRCRGAVRLSQLDRLLKIGVLDHAAVTVIRNTSLSVLAYFNPWQHKCRSSDGRIRQGDEVATVQGHFHMRQIPIRPFQVATIIFPSSYAAEPELQSCQPQGSSKVARYLARNCLFRLQVGVRAESGADNSAEQQSKYSLQNRIFLRRLHHFPTWDSGRRCPCPWPR